MSSYSFSDTAVRDLDEICNYIAVKNSKAASQLFDRVYLIILDLCSHFLVLPLV
jgi:plasmid stabilization system protein ParE